MKKAMFLSSLILISCASKPASSLPVVAPEGALILEKALQQSPEVTWTYLKERKSAKPFEGLMSADPAEKLPEELKAEKPLTALPQERKEQQAFLRKFRPQTLAKKEKRGKEIVESFSCEKAIEAQALAYSLELDFPQDEAMLLSRDLHEKVITCKDVAHNESYFRLAIFSIQRGECPRAMEYLKSFPRSEERSVNDRISYIRGFCAPDKNQVAESLNPWSGYGILLKEPVRKKTAAWYLDAKSGNENWDRLLASFVELSEKGKKSTIQYLSTKLNYEKFRGLPAPFQTSVLVLMSQAGADLSVFSTLHRFLAENPDMIAPSVLNLLFPLRYWEEIVQNSKNIDPVLVKALIRQESAFNPAARSRARASGLMQLIYPTARLYGIKKPKQLLVPEENIHAGSRFLARLIDQFGSVELALAAYNAGPAMVKQWQKRYPTDNVHLFVEMIPYSETREYVRLVTRNYRIYQALVPPASQVLGKRDSM